MTTDLIFILGIAVFAAALGLYARRQGKKYNLRQQAKKHGADFTGI